MTELSQSEISKMEKKLEACENSMREGFQSFVKAVNIIKTEHLYRCQGFETFEEYCQQTWGWSRGRGYQLANAHILIESLPDDCVQFVHTEGQARALAEVPKEERAEVLKAVAKAGPVTAAAITAAAPKKEKTIELCDKTGHPIPKDLIPLFNRGEEIQALLSAVSKIKSAVKTGQEDKDLLWATANFNNLHADLSNLYRHLSEAMPHAVCPTCAGHQAKKCTLCKGRGFLSAFAYKTFVPSETKAIREKAKK